MSRGGSRWGAGRPGSRVKAEQTQRIDIRTWRSQRKLYSGSRFTWSWHRGDEPAGRIGVAVSERSILLEYALSGEGRREDASQTIAVTRTPCRFGGTRQWFACPLCASRVELLYLRSGRFACRRCQRITYTSQCHGASDRLCTQYHRLNDQVERGKPKWQRQQTWDRLLAKWVEVAERFEAELLTHVRALGLES